MLVELRPTILALKYFCLVCSLILVSTIVARVRIICRRIIISAISLICLLDLSLEHSIGLIKSILDY